MRTAASCRAAAAALCLAAIAAPLHAAPAAVVAYELVIDGSLGRQPGSINVPLFTLKNLSDEADLTGFSLTIGDPAFNFDGVIGIVPPAGGAATLLEGDTHVDRVDGVNTETVRLGFEGLAPGASASFGIDIDPDTGGFYADFREVLFGNGGAPNAVASARFAGSAAPLLLTLADATDDALVYRARIAGAGRPAGRW